MNAYHYCSTNALSNIVQSEKFRLGSLFCMNDEKELWWLRWIALGEVETRLNQEPDNAYLHALRKRLCSLNREGKQVYCGCFTVHPDDPRMWTDYADGREGVVMKVDLQAVVDANRPAGLESWTVVYDEAQQRQVAIGIIDRKCPSGDDLQEMTLSANQAYYFLALEAVRYKSADWSKEDEIRLIARSAIEGTSPTMIRDHKSEPSLEIASYERDGVSIPCAFIQCPAAAIQCVRFGAECPVRKRNELLSLLRSRGIRT